MTIDDQELRDRLEQAAAQASAPRFTAGDLGRRIRRHRVRVITAVSGAAVAAAAIAVTVPAALSGADQPSIDNPSRVPPGPSYTVTVNGQTEAHRLPRYVITPGENLAIILDVTVPAHVTMTALWLGITNGELSPGPDGPSNMSPILVARPHARLLPGVHRFRLRWVVPGGLRPGSSRQLSAEWAWPGGTWPPGTAEGVIAELDMQGASGA